MHWITGWILLSILVVIYVISEDWDYLGSYGGKDYALTCGGALLGPIFWLIFGVGLLYQAFSDWRERRC